MAVRTITLANSVDSAENVRFALSSLVQATGPLDSLSGVFPSGSTPSPFALASVSAMVCSIGTGRAYIDGTASATQGGYELINDALFNVTFANGEASVARVDRVSATVFHNFYDGSGSTLANIVYTKGQASGLANAIPANSLLLYEVTVPAGASAAGSGINFVTATVDKRVYAVAAGGIRPIASLTERTAIVNPYKGMMISRTDFPWQEVYDGTHWRVKGVAQVSNVAALANITDPVDGQLAVTTSGTNVIYEFITSAWQIYSGNIRSGNVSITPSSAGVPTSASVTYSSLTGTTFTGQATADTTVPGTATGVAGVSIQGVTATGATVYVTRGNTTATFVYWIAYGF